MTKKELLKRLIGMDDNDVLSVNERDLGVERATEKDASDLMSELHSIIGDDFEDEIVMPDFDALDAEAAHSTLRGRSLDELVNRDEYPLGEPSTDEDFVRFPKVSETEMHRPQKRLVTTKLYHPQGYRSDSDNPMLKDSFIRGLFRLCCDLSLTMRIQPQGWRYKAWMDVWAGVGLFGYLVPDTDPENPYILYHPADIRVEFSDGRMYSAATLAAEHGVDIRTIYEAMVQFEPHNTPTEIKDKVESMVRYRKGFDTGNFNFPSFGAYSGDHD